MEKPNYEPPKLPEKILRRICRDEIFDEIIGDLHEYYQEQRSNTKKWQADLSYWYHTLQFLRPFVFKKNRNQTSSYMLHIHFKTAWRSILKSKQFSVLNIANLSIGIACFLFIFIYVANELNYDSYHHDADSIKRVVIDFVDDKGERLPDATSPPALAPSLLSGFEEVKCATRFLPNWGNKFLIGSSEERKFFEKEVLRVDSLFFTVFTAQFLYGDPSTALNDMNSVVLTESAAQKHFGKSDVIGEELTYFRSDEDRILIVTGIVEDVPPNSHFEYDFLMRLTYSNLDQNWGWYNYYTYIKLIDNANEVAFEDKLQPFFKANDPVEDNYNIIYTQPLKSIHLKSDLKWELGANGSMTNIFIFSGLGIFVLIISCLNYLNLSIAQSFKKVKEVGIRKTFGASKMSLTTQFICESFIITIFSLLIGFFLAQFFFHYFQELIGYQLSLLEVAYSEYLLIATFSTVLIGLISGIYPAVYFSSFKVLSSIKNQLKGNRDSIFSMRKILLIIQFSLSVLMICGSLTVYEQLNFLNTKDKGINTEQVLVIENARNLRDPSIFKNELLKTTGVKSASFSNGIIGALNWTTQLGYPESFLMNYIVVNPDMIETLDMELVAGRDFDASISTDHQGLQLVVNETALDALDLGFSDVGKEFPITANEQDSIIYGRIIGVVKDFHFSDYKTPIKPFALVSRQASLDYASIKIEGGEISNTINQIESIWQTTANGVPMEYSFLDETFDKLYKQEEKLSEILISLTCLSLLIALVGMYAIASISIKDKMKEIAVRKVLGSSTMKVTQLVTNKFLVLVLLANLLVIPLSVYLLSEWLSNFEYRIELHAGVFAIALIATLVISGITVGFQSLKAAMTNTIKVLRQD